VTPPRSTHPASRICIVLAMAVLLAAGGSPATPGFDATSRVGAGRLLTVAATTPLAVRSAPTDVVSSSPLAAATAASTATVPPIAAAAGGSSADGGSGRQPSIVYEEAIAHEADRIKFTPGARVTVPFTPRADDRWPIDGRAPTSLPAGRASGLAMAASQQGSQWARVPGVPAPTGDHIPDPTVQATAVGYVVPSADPGVDTAAASRLRRQVFGFLPYWELSGASKLNDDLLSTIAYFSVGADKAGNLRKRNANGTRTTGWAGWTSAAMTSVIDQAHRHGTRVVLTVSVFAWTTTQATVQRALLGSSSARLTFARQVAAAVRDRGADGVNLDFEPLVSGYESQFVSLLRSVRSELNRVRSGYQLTYDTTGYIGNYPLEASVGRGAADAVFVMGYDYRTASSSTVGSVDPLSGPRYDLADTVRTYVARIGPSRVILGLPWYGRAWSTASDSVRAANISGARYGYSTAVNYETVVGLVAKYGRRWDGVEQSPYLVYRRKSCTSTYGCVTSWRQVYYDDAASLRARYAVVEDYGLRGAGIWALGYDGGHAELYRALSQSFQVDKTAPEAGITMLPTRERDEGFVVAWKGRDVSSIASYDVQVSVDGGPWTTWRSRTRATSDVWLGANGHGYAFRVRATDSKGNAGGWTSTTTWSSSPALAVGGFGRVTRDGLAYRTGPDTSAARLGALARGTIVAITSGPVRADGYTWWEVTQPIAEWGPVSFVERGVWIAGSSATSSYIAAYRAPSSTTVAAGLRGLDFGAGGAVGTGATAAATRSFSPNGDGSGDGLQLRWTNTLALDSLTLNVFRADGALVGSRNVPDTGKGAQSWIWNGRAGSGPVPDGRYVLQLVGVAGAQTFRAPSSRPVTPAQVSAYGVLVDTVAPTLVSMGSDRTLLSPNGDGRRDAVTLDLVSKGATHWTVRIVDAAGATVRAASGRGRSLHFVWAGTADGGRVVPDGTYRASLLAFDDAGNAAGGTITLRVDTTAPTLTRTASPVVFSPNGDGALERTRLAWSASEPAWGTARIWRGSHLIRSWRIVGARGVSVVWDGRDASGSPVGDGRYRFELHVRDAARNWTTSATRVIVDRTASSLRWSGSFYPQDGDALARTSQLTWSLTRTATTTLRVYDASGRLVRTAWSGRGLAAGRHHWTWNGRRSDGGSVDPGRYEARLTVTSPLGTTELRSAVWVTPYRITRSASTVRTGQTLTVRFVSIEPLAAPPRVTLRQPGRTAVTVKATRRSDGQYEAVLRIQPGSAGQGSITIAAPDTGGQRNRMTIPIVVRT
jgi:spore germination protein YaaH/flagellar hook assembly protein FlgD